MRKTIISLAVLVVTFGSVGSCFSQEIDVAINVLNDPEHPHYQWIKNSLPQLLLFPGMGSGVIWGSSVDSGQVLALTALHVAIGMDPSMRKPILDPQGSGDNLSVDGFDGEIYAFRPIYSPGLSKKIKVENTPVRNDFMVGVLEGLEPSTVVELPKIETGAVNIGEEILILGYPLMTQKLLWYGVGKVIDTDTAVLEFEKAGGVYDEKIEFGISSNAVIGMSGGAGFNKKGQLVGVLVRGGQDYARLVKTEYIIQQIQQNSCAHLLSGR